MNFPLKNLFKKPFRAFCKKRYNKKLAKTNFCQSYKRIEPKEKNNTMKQSYSVMQRIPPSDKPKIVDYTKYFHTMTSQSEEKPQKATMLVPHSYWFIGDLHGNIKEYQNILKTIRKQDPDCITIQVGDIELEDPKTIDFLGKKDFFIQGNHDYLKPCEQHPNFLGKF